MISRLAIVSLILIVFSSCANDTDTKKPYITTTDYGACSQSFIDDHNAIVISGKNYAQFAGTLRPSDALTTTLAVELKEKLTSVNNACENFKSRHAGVVFCRAMRDKRESYIFSNEFDVACESANKDLKKITEAIASGKLGSTPQSISAPSLSAPSVPAASLSVASVSYPRLSGINIKETTADYKIFVLDYERLLSLADKNEALVEQGRVYHPVSSGPYQNYLSSKQGMICDVTREEPSTQKSELNPNPSPESIPVLTVMNYSETVVDDESGKQSRFLELSFNETNLKIYCFKDEPQAEYTWSELQYTFSKIIEVKKIKPGAAISSRSTN